MGKLKLFRHKPSKNSIQTKVTREEIKMLQRIALNRYSKGFDERLKTPQEIAYELVFNKGTILNLSEEYYTGITANKNNQPGVLNLVPLNNKNHEKKENRKLVTK